MKRLFSLVAILAIVIASNCSRIPENNDPVIGVWSRTEISQSTTGKLSVRQEWIFNDAYLGRYHSYEGNTLVFKTDFKWEQEDGLYTISYPGTDMAMAEVRMKEEPEEVILQDEKGNILAKRE
jgi:hypothetical protein